MVKTKSEEWDFQPLSELVMGGRVTGTSPADTRTIPFLGVNKPAVCHHCQQTQHIRLLKHPSLT